MMKVQPELTVSLVNFSAEQPSGWSHLFALARAVYKTNDRRAQLKREINLLFNSAIVEEKSYA